MIMKRLLSFVVLAIFVSCSSETEKQAQPQDTTTAIVLPIPPAQEPEPKTPEAKTEFQFVPKKIEITKAITRVDTIYNGDGCYCPVIGKHFKFRLFLFDSTNTQYPIEIDTYQHLKDYEGSDIIKKAKLVKTYKDNTDAEYVRAKKMYKLVTSMPYTNFIVTAKPGGLGYHITFTYKTEDKKQKIGFAYIKKEPDEMLWYGESDDRLLDANNPLY
jgi:hypothetical protein